MTEIQNPTGPRLDDKVVILTGAAGNIGSHISRHFLREGARLVMTGRNLDKLTTFANTLIDEGHSADRIYPLAADAADPDACRRALETAVERFGSVDVLVNNAGGAGPKKRLQQIPFDEADLVRPGESETMLDAVKNLLGGPWNMVRAAVPHFRPGASVINVSTIFSRTSYFGRIPYVVPKSGLNALSLGLARELGKSDHGIRVNTVFPGPIASERIDTVFKAMDDLQGFEPGATSKEFRDLMILRRSAESEAMDFVYPTPDDVASTVLWLASPESRAFSGHSFEVTNGMQVPAQSRSKLVSWPDKRLVDLRGKVVLILGGRDVDEALAFAERQVGLGAKVVLAFRAIDSLERARFQVQSTPLRGMPLLLLNPLRRENVERTMEFISDQHGRLDGVVVLPSRRNFGHDLAGATDEDVDRFLRDEVVAPVALSSAVASLIHSWPELEQAPAITFVTNADDGAGNGLYEINRAAIEELIRVWRREEEHEVKLGERRWSCRPNQIVRFDNDEPDNLAFSADWTATLTNRVRKMDAINLWVPRNIRRATGKSSMPLSIQRVLPGLHLGKTAMITGGSVGIGFQLGRFLALAGAKVLLAARNPHRLEAARASIIAELSRVGYPEPAKRVFILANVDVGDEASLQRLYEHTVDLFGELDILINNAGISGAEEMVVDMELDAWDRTMEANLISNYSLTRMFAPQMKRNGRGNILNVSSYFGGEKYLAVAYPNRSDYSVSKAGQRALAEILSRHLGPEIQINALAPGPVDGQRLRGTPEQPGLFERRGRLILENKRLNALHTAVLGSVAEGMAAGEVLARFATNSTEELARWEDAPAAVKKLLAGIQRGEPDSVARRYLAPESVAQKLVARLFNGGVIDDDLGRHFVGEHVAAPETFFDRSEIAKEAEKVESGIVGRLHLKRMPTDEQVAISTVFALVDENVSGETFHPSGGLKFERSVTEGELMLKPGRDHLEQLKGKNVILVGEALKDELRALAEAFSELAVDNIVVLTRETSTADELGRLLPEREGVGLAGEAIADDLQEALMRHHARLGRVDIVVNTPFARLPMHALAGDTMHSWQRVLSRDDFAGVVRDQLTHHFRTAKIAALWPRCQIVLVTPDTSRASTREEFALALFVKNSLHAFTVTLGVEGERIPTWPAVNQVQLTRRARTEEPGNDQEVKEEMVRFVAAVMNCSLPAPTPAESRYLARIYRGNAVTV